MSTLEMNYRGASLKVEITAKTVALSINGLQRDQKALSDLEQTLRLSSTVQTDYEWHEFIEAILTTGADRIRVCLYANNQLLGEEEVVVP